MHYVKTALVAIVAIAIVARVPMVRDLVLPK